MGETTSGRSRQALKIVVAAVLVIGLLLALAVTVFVRGGLAHPADRARADAVEGYAQWSVPFAEEAAARQAALEPVLGRPIGETWYIVCSGFAPAGPVPTAQSCSVDVQTTYAIDWTDPQTAVAAMITTLEGTDATTGDEVTAGEGGPWTEVPRDAQDEPRGRVAEAGAHGSVYVYAPGPGPQTLDHLPPVDVFPDGVLTKRTVEESGPPGGHGQVRIRRSVGISRTNIGCLPRTSLSCGTLLREAAMPEIEGYS